MTYTKDQLDDAFIAGQRSAKPHGNDKMSDETKQQFIKMGEEITQLKVTSARIETKVDNIIDTLKAHIQEEGEYRRSQDAYHKQIMEQKADKVIVDDLKDNQKWVVRSIIGIVISAIVGLIIVK
jgi:hypothetical protein